MKRDSKSERPFKLYTQPLQLVTASVQKNKEYYFVGKRVCVFVCKNKGPFASQLLALGNLRACCVP